MICHLGKKVSTGGRSVDYGPTLMLFIKMSLLCVMIALLVGNVATEGEFEFFQSDEATFKCEHGLTASELTEIEWKINGRRCAGVKYIAGSVNDQFFDCGLQNRTKVARTNITISSLMTSDEGEFRCAVAKDYATILTEVVTYNVTVKVHPRNQHLLFENQSYNCSSELIINNIDENSTLKCSVYSKPQADFTWTTEPVLSKPLQHATVCDQGEDKVFNCTNVLTLSNKDLPISGILVTCHVHALGNTTDLCVKLVPLSTTQAVPTTTDSSTAASTSVPRSTTQTVTTTTTADSSTAASTSVPLSTTQAVTTTTAADSSTAASTSVPLSTTQAVTITTAADSSTAASTSASIQVLVKLPNEKYQDEMGNNSTAIFKEKRSTYCTATVNIFKNILQQCYVSEIRNGCVLIDSILTFDLVALTTLAADTGKDNVNDVIKEKIENSNLSPFEGAKVSYMPETETTSSDTTRSSVEGSWTTPTQTTSSKWKNIYIVPIVTGIAIVVVVVVIIIISRKYRKKRSPGNHSQQGREHRSPHASLPVYHTYASISDATPKAHHRKPHEPNTRSPSRHHHDKRPGYVINNGKSHHSANRRSEPGNRNVRDTRHVQVNRQSRGATRYDYNIRGHPYVVRHTNEVGGPPIGRPAFPYMAKMYHNRYTGRVF